MNEKQIRMDKLYLRLAIEISKMSYAERKKVGCVIVKNDNIISFGWNGTPTGMDNKCEDDNNITKKEVLHAEANALTKLLKSENSISTAGATLYVSLSPCFECSKLIYQSGIKRLVYIEKYRNIEGLIFLEKMGIDICQYSIEEIYQL